MADSTLSKDNLSRIADALNAALADAKNPDCGGESVIAALDHAQREIESICPASWYPARDTEFDRVRRQVKAAELDRREDIVREFYMHIIDLLYNEFDIEP